MRVLVTGANGMLGRRVVEAFSAAHEVIATARCSGDGVEALDVTDHAAVGSVLRRVRPDVVVNCAAYTDVDGAESDGDAAYRLNTLAPGHLAWACRDVEAALFHIGTDYVFDGEKGRAYDEWDTPRPLSAYGRSKLGGERAVVESGARFWIGRVQWLYDDRTPNFATRILDLSRRHPMLRVVDDQIGCPTHARHAAEQVQRIVESGRYGLYHMSSRGETSWWGFTRALLDAEGREDYLVEKVTTDAFPRPAARPRNSVLRNRALELTIGDDMPSWEAGVEEFTRRRQEMNW